MHEFFPLLFISSTANASPIWNEVINGVISVPIMIEIIDFHSQPHDLEIRRLKRARLRPVRLQAGFSEL
jgi:hypothetical protein